MQAWRQYQAFIPPPNPAEKTQEGTVLASEPHPNASDPARTDGTPVANGSSTLANTDLRLSPSSSETTAIGLHDSPLQPTPIRPDQNGELNGQQTPPSNDAGGNGSASKPIYVSFEENDPLDPHHWSTVYKAWVVFQLIFLTLSLTFASSAASPAEKGMMEEFACGQVAATATTGIFLVGTGLGALPFAPLSERKCLDGIPIWIWC